MKTARAFTIVELLIVIVVIAILAAITIVAYNGIQRRAHDTSVQSDISNISHRIKLYHSEYGYYPATTQLSSLGLRVSKGSYETAGNALIYCVNSSQSNYAIVGKSKSQNTWYANSDNGGAVQAYTNTFPVSGATVCPLLNVASPNWYWLHDTATVGWVSWL